MANGPFLVLDVGTTGVKALVFQSGGRVTGRAYARFETRSPQPGWVEQDPGEYIELSRRVMEEAVRVSGLRPSHIVGMGIATQRETVVAWDRKSGQPLHPAIVWQDGRTADWCNQRSPEERLAVKEKTGLDLIPYFSASKIRWLLDRYGKDSRDTAVGTVDSWLMFNLLEEQPFVSDETNAARTLLLDIRTGQWDVKLLQIFDIPEYVLPQVNPSIGEFGHLKKEWLGSRIPVLAVCGDQQASLAAALELGRRNRWKEKYGLTKLTFGTGLFVNQYFGEEMYADSDGFTTLMPRAERQALRYAYERKVSDRCGSLVEPYIDRPDKENELVDALEGLSAPSADAVASLPLPARHIVIDGGVIRRPQLQPLLEKHLGRPVTPQKTYDGTALGMYYLLQSALS